MSPEGEFLRLDRLRKTLLVFQVLIILFVVWFLYARGIGGVWLDVIYLLVIAAAIVSTMYVQRQLEKALPRSPRRFLTTLCALAIVVLVALVIWFSGQ
jgi:uncharacterized membrane protein SirB2